MAPLRLFVFRHGPAEEADPHRWPDDSGRPLTPEGVRETRRAARSFAKLAGPVGRIATSPLVRARTTADLLSTAWPKAPRLEVWGELASGELAAPILERVGRTDGRRGDLVLVGHEPTLGEFVGLAVTGEAVPVCRLSKAGAALLEFPKRVVPGGASISWILTRKQLIARPR